MGKRISFLFRLVRAVVRSRVIRYGVMALVVLLLAWVGYQQWHKWYTRIPGLAGEIVRNRSFDSSLLLQLAVAPEKERLQVLDTLLRSPGSKHIGYEPDSQVMHAIVGLDYDGAFSRQIVEQVLPHALHERDDLFGMLFHLNPTTLDGVAGVIAKEMVNAKDTEEFGERAYQLIYLVPHLTKDDLSAIGSRIVEFWLTGQMPRTTANRLAWTFLDISPYFERVDASAWGDLLAGKLVQSSDPNEINNLSSLLVLLSPSAGEIKASQWGEEILAKLETQKNYELFYDLAELATDLAHHASLEYGRKLDSLLFARMCEAGEDWKAIFRLLARTDPLRDPASITAAGDLLIERALTRLHEMRHEHFEKLGRCASSEDLASWAERILYQMQATDKPERVYELDGFLESLLLESPQVASDLRASTMLERIKAETDPDKRRNLQRSLLNLLKKVAPYVSLEAKHALRQTINEMMMATDDIHVLHPLSQSLALLCTPTPMPELLPLANVLLARAEATQSKDLAEFVDIVEVLAEFISFLPPMEVEELGDAILDYELSEVALCEERISAKSLFNMTAPRAKASTTRVKATTPSVKASTTRTDPGVAQSVKVLGALACNLSGSRSSAWGTKIIDYLEQAQGAGRPGVHKFLVVLAPCAPEADVVLWGQVVIDATIESKDWVLFDLCDDLVVLATWAPSLDVRPAIDRVFLSRPNHWWLDSGNPDLQRFMKLLALPQVPPEYKAQLWKDVSLPPAGIWDKSLLGDLLPFWLYNFPPVLSETEKSLHAQQCLDLLANPLTDGKYRSMLIEYLGVIAGKDFSRTHTFAVQQNQDRLSWPRPGDLWKVLDWAASAEGQALGLKIHRQPILSLNEGAPSAN